MLIFLIQVLVLISLPTTLLLLFVSHHNLIIVYTVDCTFHQFCQHMCQQIWKLSENQHCYFVLFIICFLIYICTCSTFPRFCMTFQFLFPQHKTLSGSFSISCQSGFELKPIFSVVLCVWY